MNEIKLQKPLMWKMWIEPWYISYALLGISVAGILPILIPLAVIERGSIADVGLVVAALNLGGLAAPWWGTLADRYRLHRLLLASGFITTATAIALFPFQSALSIKIILALILGTGAAAAATVANLFIVEGHPKEEWEKRIGWLQTFYGTGQVAGLLLAGFLSRMEVHQSLLITSGLTAVAFFPGWFKTKTPPRIFEQRPILTHPPRHIELHFGSLQRFYHHLNIIAVQRLFHSFFSPFGLFLAAWLISFSGVAAYFSLFPVLMKQAYGVDPVISSSGFAVSAAIGLTLYAPAGNWSNKFGSLRIIQTALAIRLIAFAGFIFMNLTYSDGIGSFALLNLLFVVLAWSLLSVSGTALTAEYSKSNEGEGIGIFNATTAIGGVIGAVLGGWVASRYGFQKVPMLALIGVIVGLLITFTISNIRKKLNSG